MADKPPVFLPLPLPGIGGNAPSAPVSTSSAPAAITRDASPEPVDREFERTKQRIRQLEAKALRGLRGPSAESDAESDDNDDESVDGDEGIDVAANLEEVGQDFEVTRQRIREIEARALAKLRSPDRSAALQAFIDGDAADEAGDDDDDEADEDDE